MKTLYWLSGISLFTVAAVGTGVGIKMEHEKNAARRYEEVIRSQQKLEHVKTEDECTKNNGMWSDINKNNPGCYKYT